jgi:hypothetical protein
MESIITARVTAQRGRGDADARAVARAVFRGTGDPPVVGVLTHVGAA